jgi:hypothetical protein
MKRYRYANGEHEAFLEPPTDGTPVPAMLKLPVGGEWVIFRLMGDVGIKRAMRPLDRKNVHPSELSYEEILYAPVGSPALKVLFALRNLAEELRVDVNTQAPLEDGSLSSFQAHGGWRAKTIKELAADINAVL